MLYGPTEEQQMVLESLRKYLDAELEAAFLAHNEGFISKDTMAGWMLTHLMIFEEVAYTSLDVAIPGMINAIGAEFLRRFASIETQERYLPSLVSGRKFIAMGISEPDVGSDVASIRTRAVRDGDDWVINGEKTWITSGGYSDVLICTCRTGDEEITHLLVDREEHGYEVAEIPKLALNGQSTSQIFLSDVRVPVTNTVGEVGAGLRNTLKVFELARCHMAIWGVGVARRAMDEAIGYSQNRIQHGKPIAGHQLIADKLATMATKIDAARMLAHRAISMVQDGVRADKECAMAKWYGTEIGFEAARDALQIHGGNGVTKGFLVERLVREAIISPIPDGTTEIQKLIIARALTGIDAFR
jgi:alkylation response protein AidB-like acyl-CoA dehydrogenase